MLVVFRRVLDVFLEGVGAVVEVVAVVVVPQVAIVAVEEALMGNSYFLSSHRSDSSKFLSKFSKIIIPFPS